MVDIESIIEDKLGEHIKELRQAYDEGDRRRVKSVAANVVELAQQLRKGALERLRGGAKREQNAKTLSCGEPKVGDMQSPFEEDEKLSRILELGEILEDIKYTYDLGHWEIVEAFAASMAQSAKVLKAGALKRKRPGKWDP